MFDAKLRPLIDPPLNRLGGALATRGVRANHLTIGSGVLGVFAGIAIAFGWFPLALAAIVASRLLDGLDGAVARATSPSDIGGFLDIVADFFFYVAVPIGFGLRDAQNLAPALFLVASFALTGVSFLAYAAIAEKRGRKTEAHGKKSFYYSTGLAEGTETIVAFVLMCLAPGWFPLIAWAFASLCVLTVIQRTSLVYSEFRE